MEDDALDRDARIKLSIGTKERGDADGEFNDPLGLVFDHHRGLLLVADCSNDRVQVFSCDGDDDCSFVSKFGEQGDQPGQFRCPWGIAIDHDHDRMLVTDYANDRVQSWSLSEQSFLSCIGHQGSGDLEFFNPRGIAIDKHHRRIIIADSNHNRLCSCRRSIFRSCSRSARGKDLDLASSTVQQRLRSTMIDIESSSVIP